MIYLNYIAFVNKFNYFYKKTIYLAFKLIYKLILKIQSYFKKNNKIIII